MPQKQECQKCRGGHSNIQHGDQNNTVNNNTKRHKIDTASPSQVQVQGSSNKWVRNISSTPLTEAQIKLLSHGPNYTMVPKNAPIIEYIATIEKACTSLQPHKAEELRGELKANIKKMQPPRYNLTKEEHRAMEELKGDKTRMILTLTRGSPLWFKIKKSTLRRQMSY